MKHTLFKAILKSHKKPKDFLKWTQKIIKKYLWSIIKAKQITSPLIAFSPLWTLFRPAHLIVINRFHLFSAPSGHQPWAPTLSGLENIRDWKQINYVQYFVGLLPIFKHELVPSLSIFYFIFLSTRYLLSLDSRNISQNIIEISLNWNFRIQSTCL